MTAPIDDPADSPSPPRPRASGSPDSSAAGRDVLAALGVNPTPTPVAHPDPAAVEATEPAPHSGVDSTALGRSVIDALRTDSSPNRTAPTTAPRDPHVDSTAAGRSVVDALRDPTAQTTKAPKVTKSETPKAPRRETRPKIKPARPVAPVSSDRPELVADTTTREAVARVVRSPRLEVVPADEPRRPAPPPRVAVPPEVKVSRWTVPDEPADAGQAAIDAQFHARGGARKILSIVLLVSLAASGTAGYLAYRDQTPGTIGIAGILGFLTLVIWAIRAGSTTTWTAFQRGRLVMKRSGRTEIVDLSSSFTPIAIVGQPGHRRWTVLIERTGQPLLVINSSMVEPHWFTAALYRLRPELRPSAVVDASELKDEYAEIG